MLIDGLEWCRLLVDYCGVFISCLDSHFDGTHSLQRIHWWTSDVMLHFSKSVQMKKQTWKAWGWALFHFWVKFSFKSSSVKNTFSYRENECSFYLFNPTVALYTSCGHYKLSCKSRFLEKITAKNFGTTWGRVNKTRFVHIRAAPPHIKSGSSQQAVREHLSLLLWVCFSGAGR